MNARELHLLFNCLTIISSICNSVCTARQWTPELDPVKFAQQQAKVFQIIQDQKASALELKYHTYPDTRPYDWEPSQQDIDSEVDGQGNDDEHYGPPISQRLEQHLKSAFDTGIPPFEALFGSALVERINARSEYMKARKRGRPRKADSSSSGWRLPSGSLNQQINGAAVPNSKQQSAKGPSKLALEGVARRCGGLVDFGTLVANNNVPGRVLVSAIFTLHHVYSPYPFRHQNMRKH